MQEPTLFLGALIVGILAPAGLLIAWRDAYLLSARIVAVTCLVGVGCGFLPNTFWLCLTAGFVIAFFVFKGIGGVPPQARKRFAFLVLMMGVVAGLSGQAGGAAPFRDFLSLQMHLPADTVDTVTYFGRKSIHVLAYATLSIAAFRYQVLGRSGLWLVFVGALWWQVVTASGDELRQSFTPGRTGLVSDVILDTVAGVCGLILAAALFTWGEQRAAG